MGEPNFSKIFPKRFITMSMADKYMAVCFIYDGIQYQDLCKEENPDGTFNLSEKCLAKLPFHLPPFIGYDANTSLNNEQALVRYNPNQSDFPDILSAISYYWFEVLLLCLFSALIFHIGFIILRRRSSNYINGVFQDSKLSAGPTVDEKGSIRIGKLSFDPKLVLGYGSKGTCVFKGYFEDSLKCAVKRVVSQHLTLADREVEFLRSLQHPNLVRYLATEEDAQFIYIALEIAEFTLGDLMSENQADIGLSKEELCRQAALGLHHLHKLDIVHRDIKPQNILISFPMKPNNDRKVMISDFGLSKQLNNLDIGHTSTAMRYFDGTQGWMAPEIVIAKQGEDKSLLPTKSADVFSLGCVFYYIISNGQHLFGQLDQRQDNILENRNQLDLINEKLLDISEDKAVLAEKLIRSMVEKLPQDRPPIGAILNYPFFWSKARQLQFLLDVSDRIDKEDRKSGLIPLVEYERHKIWYGKKGWKECLSKELYDSVLEDRHRTYRERSVRDLLRLIRNKKNHYRDQTEELKKSLGDVPDEFIVYFTSRFPLLLPRIYDAMKSCRVEKDFEMYYEQLDNYVLSR